MNLKCGVTLSIDVFVIIKPLKGVYFVNRCPARTLKDLVEEENALLSPPLNLN